MAQGWTLPQFRRWYEQAGTPQVQARLEHDAASATATLHLRQSFAPTPGQPDKPLMPIPLRTALIDRDMKAHRGEQLVMLTEAEQSFAFTGFAQPPVLSINRGFSAPVNARCRAAQPATCCSWCGTMMIRSRATRRCSSW